MLRLHRKNNSNIQLSSFLWPGEPTAHLENCDLPTVNRFVWVCGDSDAIVIVTIQKQQYFHSASQVMTLFHEYLKVPHSHFKSTASIHQLIFSSELCLEQTTLCWISVVFPKIQVFRAAVKNAVGLIENVCVDACSDYHCNCHVSEPTLTPSSNQVTRLHWEQTSTRYSCDVPKLGKHLLPLSAVEPQNRPVKSAVWCEIVCVPLKLSTRRFTCQPLSQRDKHTVNSQTATF